jgi:hypothetical protein
MKDGRDKLTALKEELQNSIQTSTSSYIEGGTWEDHAARIKEVGQCLKYFSKDLERCDNYITAVRKKINVVESLRKRTKIFMEAPPKLNSMSSYVTWAKSKQNWSDARCKGSKEEGQR